MFAVSLSKIKLFISLEIVIITFSDRTYDWLISVAIVETQLFHPVQQVVREASENLDHVYIFVSRLLP